MGLRFIIASTVTRDLSGAGKAPALSLLSMAELGTRARVLGGAPVSEFGFESLSPSVIKLEAAVGTLSSNGCRGASWLGLPGVNPPVVSAEDRDS